MLAPAIIEHKEFGELVQTGLLTICGRLKQSMMHSMTVNGTDVEHPTVDLVLDSDTSAKLVQDAVARRGLAISYRASEYAAARADIHHEDEPHKPHGVAPGALLGIGLSGVLLVVWAVLVLTVVVRRKRKLAELTDAVALTSSDDTSRSPSDASSPGPASTAVGQSHGTRADADDAPEPRAPLSSLDPPRSPPDADEAGLYTTPLHAAVAMGDTAQVLALLQQGANVNARNSNGQTPLHVALTASPPLEMALVEMLVHAGADLCTEDADGYNAIMLAVVSGHSGVLQRVRPHGSLSRREQRGLTALMLAAMHNRIECATILLKESPVGWVNAQDHRGWSALHWACAVGSVRMARMLCNQGMANIALTTHHGETCLHLAARENHREIVDLICGLLPGGPPRLPSQVLFVLLARDVWASATAEDVARTLGYTSLADHLADLRQTLQNGEPLATSPAVPAPSGAEPARKRARRGKAVPSRRELDAMELRVNQLDAKNVQLAELVHKAQRQVDVLRQCAATPTYWSPSSGSSMCLPEVSFV